MKRQLMKLAVVGTAAAGMIFAQAPAQAQTSQPKHSNLAKSHRATARRRMLQQLNLTPAQKEHAKAIFQQSREAAKPVRGQLRQNRVAMAAAVKVNNKAQIEQLSAERGKLMGQLTTTRTEAMARFYSELNPQQRAKADQIKQRFQAHMRQRIGHRAIGSNS
jgi:Spy/CpxP family protein refolding chaperone